MRGRLKRIPFFYLKHDVSETGFCLCLQVVSTQILWGCASKSNISIIQRSQSKILRIIVDAPWYVSNVTLHADLGISYVQDVIHQKCNKHHTTLETHENPLLKNTTGKRRK
jgi:hypothetical protein